METGARGIEVWNLRWSDIDQQTGMVSITPAKNGNPRDLPVSDQLLTMLNLLPKDTEYIFKKGKLSSFRDGFGKHRKKLAAELGDPEILKCSFKTFGTFFGTKVSRKFNNPWETKYRLGHRKIETTELYVRREAAMRREYATQIVKTIEEALKATQEGFEHHATIEDVQIWRKPV